MSEQSPAYNNDIEQINVYKLETALISHLLNNTELFKANMQIFERDIFSTGSTIGKVFNAYREIINTGNEPDYVSISDKSKISLETVIEFYTAVDYRFEFKNTLQKLIEYRIKQNLITFAHTLIGNLSKNNDVFTEIGKLKEFIDNNELTPIRRISSINETISQLIEGITARRDGKVTGIRTGLTKLDNHTGGLQPSDLFVIAGETSQGKTSIALSIAYNTAVNHAARIAIFSLEMSTNHLTDRLTSMEGGISRKKILFYPLHTYDVDKIATMQHLPYSGIFIDDCSNSSIDYIITGIRQAHMQYKIQVAIVDYLQLIKDSSKRNEEAEISSNTRRLKNLAKELDITVILLSQLHRDKGNPKPTLSRLRGSGQIEEAADIVGLIWRPELYGMLTHESNSSLSTSGTAEFIIAKGRNYGIGSMILNYNDRLTYFSDLKEEPNNDFTAGDVAPY